MGRLRTFGQEIIKYKPILVSPKPRDLIIGGTAIGQPAVLSAMGFEVQKRFTFEEFGIDLGPSEQPNEIVIGKMGKRDVVMTLGRAHIFQDQENLTRGITESMVRRFYSVALALASGGDRVILTSSVGGIADGVKQGILVQPEDIVASHLPQLHLKPSLGEFQIPGYNFWLNHKESKTFRPHLRRAFVASCRASDFKYLRRRNAVAQAIVGTSFGSACERRIWKSLKIDIVTMSQAAGAALIGLENMDRKAASEKLIDLMSVCYVTDAHDLADHLEIKADGKARAPQFARFLKHAIEIDWE